MARPKETATRSLALLSLSAARIVIDRRILPVSLKHASLQQAVSRNVAVEPMSALAKILLVNDDRHPLSKVMANY